MSNKKKERLKRIFLVVSLVTLLVAICLIYAIPEKNEDDSYLTYDKVVSYIKEGEITKVFATSGKSDITVTMKDGTEKQAVIPSLDELTSFVSEEIENGSKIEFEIQEMNSNPTVEAFVKLLFNMFFYVMIFKLVFKKMPGANDYQVKPVTSKVKFSDVAGIDEEKGQLEEIVEFLKKPEKYIEMGAKIPKGILLSGEPGTGKTLLAKAIAGEAGVPFFQTNGSSFEERFVGVGAERVRKLFSEAKKVAPCIIFIDEIDSVAQSRYGGKSYSEQTLNQLLSEMDGFETRDNIIIIAATNHIETLDPAIIRPGRFDRKIFIPMPDVLAREKILEIHSKNKKFEEDMSLKEVAKKTVGFSGADLENILNEAAIYAVDQGKRYISKSDIDEAIARVLVGLEKKNSAISESDKWRTAVHEAGHAIVSAVVRPEVKNFGISIVPRGEAGGYNFFDERDKTYRTKKDIENELQVCYGGRIAEELILEDISTGAANDLETASRIAYNMVTKFAMDGRLLVKIRNQEVYNEQLDTATIEKVEEICDKAYEKSKRVIHNYKAQVWQLAKLLYEKEYLSREEIEYFISDNKL